MSQPKICTDKMPLFGTSEETSSQEVKGGKTCHGRDVRNQVITYLGTSTFLVLCNPSYICKDTYTQLQLQRSKISCIEKFYYQLNYQSIDLLSILSLVACVACF